MKLSVNFKYLHTLISQVIDISMKTVDQDQSEIMEVYKLPPVKSVG